tara:strand:+ start:1320 stop:1508 length:189 start_codon:yes stop_codon:yes gene_type:complete
VTNNNLQITNPKLVSVNSAVLDAAKSLFSSVGFASSDVALDAIKTAKNNHQRRHMVKWFSRN